MSVEEGWYDISSAQPQNVVVHAANIVTMGGAVLTTKGKILEIQIPCVDKAFFVDENFKAIPEDVLEALTQYLDAEEKKSHPEDRKASSEGTKGRRWSPGVEFTFKARSSGRQPSVQELKEPAPLTKTILLFCQCGSYDMAAAVLYLDGAGHALELHRPPKTHQPLPAHGQCLFYNKNPAVDLQQAPLRDIIASYSSGRQGGGEGYKKVEVLQIGDLTMEESADPPTAPLTIISRSRYVELRRGGVQVDGYYQYVIKKYPDIQVSYPNPDAGAILRHMAVRSWRVEDTYCSAFVDDVKAPTPYARLRFVLESKDLTLKVVTERGKLIFEEHLASREEYPSGDRLRGTPSRGRPPKQSLRRQDTPPSDAAEQFREPLWKVEIEKVRMQLGRLKPEG